MRYVLLGLLTIGLMTYSVIDCVRTEDSRLRLGLPHWFWVVIILALPLAGALTWLVLSNIARRRYDSPPPSRPTRGRPNRPLAPDDDPEFLFRLERDRRRARNADADATPKDSGPASEPEGAVESDSDGPVPPPEPDGPPPAGPGQPPEDTGQEGTAQDSRSDDDHDRT